MGRNRFQSKNKYRIRDHSNVLVEPIKDECHNIIQYIDKIGNYSLFTNSSEIPNLWNNYLLFFGNSQTIQEYSSWNGGLIFKRQPNVPRTRDNLLTAIKNFFIVERLHDNLSMFLYTALYFVLPWVIRSDDFQFDDTISNMIHFFLKKHEAYMHNFTYCDNTQLIHSRIIVSIAQSGPFLENMILLEMMKIAVKYCHYDIAYLHVPLFILKDSKYPTPQEVYSSSLDHLNDIVPVRKLIDLCIWKNFSNTTIVTCILRSRFVRELYEEYKRKLNFKTNQDIYIKDVSDELAKWLAQRRIQINNPLVFCQSIIYVVKHKIINFFKTLDVRSISLNTITELMVLKCLVHLAFQPQKIVQDYLRNFPLLLKHGVFWTILTMRSANNSFLGKSKYPVVDIDFRLFADIGVKSSITPYFSVEFKPE